MEDGSYVLITGGCGAIGSVVVNTLKAKYPNVNFVNVDALTYAGKREHIEPPYDNYTFIQGNICDAYLMNFLLQSYKPDYLIHLAAETHVDNSFGNSFSFTKTNIFGTHTLLECARQYGRLKKFIHMSTDEVYGSILDGETCHESSMIAPTNPYSASKAAAEMLCHAYLKSFKVPITILRCNNAISPYQHEEKLIPRTIHNILKGQKIPIHGKGQSKRTFIHARDIADAIAVVMEHGKDGAVYNIGNHEEYSVLDVVERILAKMKPGESLDEWVAYVEDRPFQDYRYSVDTSALCSLGWSSKVSFQDALEQTIEHLSKHQFQTHA
jgi:dTDP-glucose 4,6-dehydratase